MIKREPKTNSQTKQQLLLELEELRMKLDATERRLQEKRKILEVQIAGGEGAEETFDNVRKHAEVVNHSKKTAGALKNSETRYRRLFEAAQDGILILDAETGQISDVNPFLIEMLGYSHEECLGKKLWEIGAFKDVEESKVNFGELQSKGYVRYSDLPLETKDGRSIAVNLSVTSTGSIIIK